jgi:hypothetical protein
VHSSPIVTSTLSFHEGCWLALRAVPVMVLGLPPAPAMRAVRAAAGMFGRRSRISALEVDGKRPATSSVAASRAKLDFYRTKLDFYRTKLDFYRTKL